MTYQADAFTPSTVNFQLTTPIVNPLAVNNACLVSDNNTVRPSGTIKAYTKLSEVVADYGPNAPETVFSTAYFGKDVESNYLIMVGLLSAYPLDSIEVDTPGLLTGIPSVAVNGTGENASVEAVGYALALNGIQSKGQNFNVGDTLSPEGGVYTEPAILYVDELQFSSALILNGGFNFAVNDTIEMDGGTFSNPVQVTVLAVNASGTVTDYSISDFGNYTVSSNTLTQGTTTGSGSGFSLQDCVFGILSASLTQVGSYTESPANPCNFQSITGAGLNFQGTLNWGVSDLNVLTPGDGFDNTTTLSFFNATGTFPSYIISLASTGFVASTLSAGYQQAVAQRYGGFTWCNFVDKSCSPAWGTNAQTLNELIQIQQAAILNKTKWVINILSDDEGSLNQTPGCLSQLIAAQQYNGFIRVAMMGYSNFSSDPSLANKRIDAFVSALKASINLSTYEFSGPQAIIYRNNSPACTPIPIGQTDGYGIRWTESRFNSATRGVPDGQLILFGQSGERRVLAFGFILNNLYNVSLDSVAIAIYLEQYLNNVLNNLFKPPTVPNYNDEGNAICYSVIINTLKEFATVGMIGGDFSCTLPVINLNTPVPRILGPYTVTATINGVAYGIVTNGILTA
jgi:hypothetical protein